MTDKNKLAGDYEVGYCRPPKGSQFKKGQSGNKSGRRKRRNEPLSNVAEILNAPVSVRRGEKTVKMGAFEAYVRNLVKKSLNEDDVSATLELINLFEKNGEIVRQPAPDIWKGPIVVPADWGCKEWLDTYLLHGPPPWPGERDGILENPQMIEALERSNHGHGEVGDD